MPEPVAPEFIALQQAVAGRYSLEREIGRGGMGIVFLARDVALDRPVAIKLLPPALAAQSGLKQRFLGEARTAASLSHPNIVPIHAVEEHGSLVFFVMSYIEGRTLGDRLRMQGPLSPAEGSKLMQEIAWALAYAHGRGVVHRDVKPDNIILETATGRAVVMDFGIAAAVGGAGDAMGTAEYMSPEQAQGQPVDGRSDLYSLGALMFYALSGAHPFEALDTRALLAMHVTMPAPPVAAAVPGLPRRLAQAVDRCLAKDPGVRFPSGEAVAEHVVGSVEPVRQLPVPVRLWLSKNTQEMRLLYLVWYVIGGPAFGTMAGFGVAALLGPVVGWAAGVALYTGFPMGVHMLNRLWRLRRLLAQGYAVDDARLAARDFANRRREELAFENAAEPALWAKVVRWVMIGSGSTLIGVLLGGITGIARLTNPIWILPLSGVWLGTAVLQTMWPGKRVLRDRFAEWRVKFWNTRLAKWFERVARSGLKARATPAELTYRPTELAIGLAADAVFASLDKELRRELRELPAVLERLQHDAQLMRKTVEELGASLAAIGEQSPAAESQRIGDHTHQEVERLRQDLTLRRDEAAKRLAATVTALENIRIGLLRLKAGAGTSAELTADLDAARALSRDLSVHVEAQREVKELVGRHA